MGGCLDPITALDVLWRKENLLALPGLETRFFGLLLHNEFTNRPNYLGFGLIQNFTTS
jgi:hypothetical protein